MQANLKEIATAARGALGATSMVSANGETRYLAFMESDAAGSATLSTLVSQGKTYRLTEPLLVAVKAGAPGAPYMDVARALAEAGVVTNDVRGGG